MTDYSQMGDAELSRHIAEQMGYNDAAVKQGLAPAYASDLNAASELLQECFGTLEWDGEAWQVEAYGYLYASHQNPARAVCECWLQVRNTGMVENGNNNK